MKNKYLFHLTEGDTKQSFYQKYRELFYLKSKSNFTQDFLISFIKNDDIDQSWIRVVLNTFMTLKNNSGKEIGFSILIQSTIFKTFLQLSVYINGEIFLETIQRKKGER